MTESTRRRIGTAATTLVVLTAILSTVWNASRRQELLGSASIPTGQVVPNWAQFASARTDNSALVRVVVFSDYECPGCRQLHATLRRLKYRFGDKLDVTVRHYPLTIHPAALVAARAAVCADSVGRFPVMHDWLFDRGVTTETADWVQGAVASGEKDTAAFEVCRTGVGSLDAVTRDIMAGRALGIMVTPTLLIDSLLFGGAPKDLEKIIARSIAQATH